MVTIGSLFLIFAAQLVLSIVVSQGAYQIDDLQSQQKALLRTQGALDEQFNLLSSTQHLAQNAATLGMVPNGSPRFLNLATGAVVGAPGTIDPTGCGGNCGLVANSLLTGVPLATQVAPKAQTTPQISAAGNAAPPATGNTALPATVDTLPAPVTH
ncbi:MAG: hypothetical protein ABJA94_02040 [Rhodoglobus sp.]